MDSLQNLLFSIARFKEYTGRYPDRISVVGYEFKKLRFENLHRAAIRWPENKFSYYGIDPEDSGNVREAIEGEVRVCCFFNYPSQGYFQAQKWLDTLLEGSIRLPSATSR